MSVDLDSAKLWGGTRASRNNDTHKGEVEQNPSDTCSDYSVAEVEMLAADTKDISAVRGYVHDLLAALTAGGMTSPHGDETEHHGSSDTDTAKCAPVYVPAPVPGKLGVALFRHNKAAFDLLMERRIFSNRYLDIVSKL